MWSGRWFLGTVTILSLAGHYLCSSIKCYSCFEQYEQGRVSQIPCLKPAEYDVKIVTCDDNDMYCMNFMVMKGPNVTLSRGCSKGWCSHSADWSGPHIQCCMSNLCNTNIPQVEPEPLPTEEPEVPEPTSDSQQIPGLPPGAAGSQTGTNNNSPIQVPIF